MVDVFDVDVVVATVAAPLVDDDGEELVQELTVRTLSLGTANTHTCGIDQRKWTVCGKSILKGQYAERVF